METYMEEHSIELELRKFEHIPASKVAFLKKLALYLAKNAEVGLMIDGENVDMFIDTPKFEISMGEKDLVIGDFTKSTPIQKIFDEINDDCIQAILDMYKAMKLQ